jgi:hypothetical protein
MQQAKPEQAPNSLTAIAVDDRRQSGRVPGPFDAWRIGILETPMRIYDLSVGGCFVNAMHEQQQGRAFTLKIHLPFEGWIVLNAETLYRRPGFGFAVRFVDMPQETEKRLQRVIDKLQYGVSVEG